MYKNLLTTIKQLKMKKNELCIILNYEYQKKLTDRLSYNVKFTEKEEDIIYDYLKSKGYKGTKDYLLKPSPFIKKEKNRIETRLSKILNRRMKELKISNRELSEMIGVTENTVSLWKTGKSDVSIENLLPLCEALDISVSYLLDKERITDYFVGYDYEYRSLDRQKAIDRIYDLLIKYQTEVRGYKESDFKTPPHMKKIINDEIQKFIIYTSKIIDTYQPYESISNNNDFKDYEDVTKRSKEEFEKEFNEYKEIFKQPGHSNDELKKKGDKLGQLLNVRSKAKEQLLGLYDDEDNEKEKEDGKK